LRATQPPVEHCLTQTAKGLSKLHCSPVSLISSDVRTLGSKTICTPQGNSATISAPFVKELLLLSTSSSWVRGQWHFLQHSHTEASKEGGFNPQEVCLH
jgi:hypothetical protein